MLLVRTRIGNSPIHGIGIFATEFIAKGTETWRFNPDFDLVITDQIEATLSPSALEQVRNYAYTDLESGLCILCSDDARFYNHSADPNTGINPTGDLPSDYALCDIQAGEEITCNYGLFDADTAAKLSGKSPHG